LVLHTIGVMFCMLTGAVGRPRRRKGAGEENTGTP
jgi:hypothetical protein